MTVNFIRAPGAPFSEEDVRIIGEELLRIADANRLEHVSLLDKKLVFEAVEADPDNPLRRFYDWDVTSAARKHWLAFTHKMIMSVRIEWKIGKFTRPLPITLSANVSSRFKPGPVRRRILTADAMQHDPMFASAVGFRLRSVDGLLGQLEGLIGAHGKLPEAIKASFRAHRMSFNQLLQDFEGWNPK